MTRARRHTSLAWMCLALVLLAAAAVFVLARRPVLEAPDRARGRAAGEREPLPRPPPDQPRPTAEPLPPAAEPPPAAAEPAPPISIFGRVIDARGQGVAAARVLAAPAAAWDRALAEFHARRFARSDMPPAITSLRAAYERHVAPSQRTESAGDGSYAFRALGPGRYRLFAAGDGFLPSPVGEVTVADGVTAALDLVLRGGHSIAGRVLDSRGGVVGGALVAALPTSLDLALDRELAVEVFVASLLSDGAAQAALAEADGSFEVGPLNPGMHAVIATREGFAPGATRHALAGTADMELILSPGAALEGRVLDPSGLPAGGLRCLLVASAPEVLGGGAHARRWEAVTGEDGRFRIRDLTAGRYVLLLAPGSHAALARSVTIDGSAVDLGDVALEVARTLAGWVLAEGVPLAGARVWLPAPATAGDDLAMAETVTAADGRFELAGVGPGEVELRAAAEGFLPAAERLEPGAGESTIVLDRGLAASGRVVDAAAGTPVEGVIVVAGASSSPGVVTDEGGRFEIEGIAPDALEGSAGGGATIALQLLHPDYVPRLALIAAETGSGRGADIEIARRPAAAAAGGASLSGRVTTDASPVGGARLLLLPREFDAGGAPTPARAALSSDDGSYHFESVAAGTYDLEAEAPGRARARVEGLKLGGGPQVADVVLQPGAAISGRVVDGAGHPLAGVEVVAFDGWRGAAGAPEDPLLVAETLGLRAAGVAWTDAGGRYRIEHVRERELALVARGAGFAPREVAPVTPGAAAPDIVLSRLAAVRGLVVAVTPQQPVGEFQVDLRRARGQGGTLAALVTPAAVSRTSAAMRNREGRFRLEGLEPGDYTLGVVAASHQPRVQQVVLREGEEKEVVVVLEPGFELHGKVVAENGAPLAGALVAFQALPAPRGRPRDPMLRFGMPRSVRTGADGGFSFTSLGEGAFTLTAHHPRHLPAGQRFAMPRDHQQRLEIRLEPAGSVEGRLSAPAPEGAPGYRILLVPDRGTEGAGGERIALWINPRDGTFRRDGLLPGTYGIWLERRPQAADPVLVGAVEIRPGEAARLDLAPP